MRQLHTTLLLTSIGLLVACVDDDGFETTAPDPPVEAAPTTDLVRYDDFPDEPNLKYSISRTPWQQTDMTWCLSTTTSDLPEATVISLLQRAWDTWSEVTPLRFSRVDSCQSATIEVGFVDWGQRGYDFDGRGGTLAYAFLPRTGVVRFDDAENWTDQVRSGGGGDTDLLTVAIHEFGHAIGLYHSNVRSAVMYAYYGGSARSLNQDDILGAQAMYGEGTGDFDPVDPNDPVDPVDPLDPDERDDPVVPAADDHGETYSDATPVSPDVVMNGRIDARGDLDLFKLEVPTDGTYVFTTSGNTDTYCEAWSRDGRLVAQDDDGAGNRNCRLDLELGPNNKLWVRVRHWSSDGMGSYQIELTPAGGGNGDGGAPPVPSDADNDGVLDPDDLCSGTPPGAPVWTSGPWLGCAGGQYRDRDR